MKATYLSVDDQATAKLVFRMEKGRDLEAPIGVIYMPLNKLDLFLVYDVKSSRLHTIGRTPTLKQKQLDN